MAHAGYRRRRDDDDQRYHRPAGGSCDCLGRVQFCLLFLQLVYLSHDANDTLLFGSATITMSQGSLDWICMAPGCGGGRNGCQPKDHFSHCHFQVGMRWRHNANDNGTPIQNICCCTMAACPGKRATFRRLHKRLSFFQSILDRSSDRQQGLERYRNRRPDMR